MPACMLASKLVRFGWVSRGEVIAAFWSLFALLGPSGRLRMPLTIVAVLLDPRSVPAPYFSRPDC